MNEPREPLFLARDTYRQRRIRDAARLLPIIGFFALCLPILWGDEQARLTSGGVLYLFGVWIMLIVIAVVLSGRLRKIEAQDTQAQDGAPD